MTRAAFICSVLLVAGTLAEAKKSAKAVHILMKEKSELEAVQQRIADGASFADEAAKHSTCPSGKKGGDLGTFGEGQMVKEFDTVVFDPETEIGKVYGPVQTQFGYHLIKVLEREGVADKKKKKKKVKANEELTAADFQAKVVDSKEAWAVEFASAMCGSCKEFAPTWKKYAGETPPVKTGYINIDDAANMKLAQELGVMAEGIPNVRVFTGENAKGVSVVKGETPGLGELKKLMADSVKGLKKKGKKTGIYRKANGGSDEE